MSDQAANLRQRGSAKAAGAATTAAAADQQAASQDEVTTREKLEFYFAQYLGLLICVVGIALLCCGYDRGWMNNTTLCLVCLGFCLVGLFFHEFRPYSVMRNMEEEKAASDAAR